MSRVKDIISDPTLTYQQQLLALARLAENDDDSLPLKPEMKKALEEETLCDLGEGRAPYRPRYILPDYQKLMKEGCAFLGLQPPTDIWEATNALLIMYKHVPSITSFPVYLGNFADLFQGRRGNTHVPDHRRGAAARSNRMRISGHQAGVPVLLPDL